MAAAPAAPAARAPLRACRADPPARTRRSLPPTDRGTIRHERRCGGRGTSCRPRRRAIRCRDRGEAPEWWPSWSHVVADLPQQMPKRLKPRGNVGRDDLIVFDRFGADQQAIQRAGDAEVVCREFLTRLFRAVEVGVGKVGASYDAPRPPTLLPLTPVRDR